MELQIPAVLCFIPGKDNDSEWLISPKNPEQGNRVEEAVTFANT